MSSNGGYPMGAAYDIDAPYNEKEVKPIEKTVTVSITLSRTFKIKVSDYKIVDECVDTDGTSIIQVDYSDCNFVKALEEQHDLRTIDTAYWSVDEMEVIPNDY